MVYIDHRNRKEISMAFQIFRLDPWHCPITDGLVGHKTVALPMVYQSQRLAEKLAARRAEEDYNSCGDSGFVVAPVGKGPP
jgi:hypothetical protein